MYVCYKYVGDEFDMKFPSSTIPNKSTIVLVSDEFIATGNVQYEKLAEEVGIFVNC